MSVSPSMVLPPANPLRRRVSLPAPPTHRFDFSTVPPFSSSRRVRRTTTIPKVRCRSNAEEEEDEERGGRDEEVERALRLDGTIPGTSGEFVEQVSSRAYDMRRNLHQTFDTSSYDLLEANPWRQSSKPVYVLTQRENQLCTMKTRSDRSEVEGELGLLFPQGGNKRNQAKQQGNKKFQMLVEDVREGVLVFEDETEAAKYCDLLERSGEECEGVVEVEASSVFDLVRKMRALVVLFRRGRTPPQPESLRLNLKARKRSLED